jgi:hypothetical protein
LLVYFLTKLSRSYIQAASGQNLTRHFQGWFGCGMEVQFPKDAAPMPGILMVVPDAGQMQEDASET